MCICDGHMSCSYFSAVQGGSVRPACYYVQGRDGKPREWEADRVLFINDVFFCAKDIIRLLQHTDVALACGMDFNFVSLALLQTCGDRSCPAHLHAQLA